MQNLEILQHLITILDKINMKHAEYAEYVFSYFTFFRNCTLCMRTAKTMKLVRKTATNQLIINTLFTEKIGHFLSDFLIELIIFQPI